MEDFLRQLRSAAVQVAMACTLALMVLVFLKRLR